MTTPHRTLQMALDALDAITDDVDGTGLNTMPSFDKAIDAITALRAALAQPEPIDGFGGNLDDAFEPAAPTPVVPADAALNTLARLFHNGEEIEGDDGAAMMVDLSLWHEASEAFDSLIGDGDGETLASSAAPAVREPLTDARKLCTCDGAGRGPGRACVVQAGGRLGDLWKCAKSAAPAVPRHVRKIGGSFQHTGTVVAEFRTLAGESRIVLEFDAPVAGMLHVYRPDQVESITGRANG